VIPSARAFDDVVALEAQLQAERDRLRVLLDVTNAVSRERTLDGLFVAIGQALRWLVDHDGSNLCLYDPEAKALRVHTITTPDGGRGWQEGLLLPLEGTPAGLAFRTRAPVVANTQEELLAAVRFPGLEAAIRVNGLRSGCAVPLLSRGEPLGTMAFGSREEGMFDAARVALLVQLAAQLAPAVDNAVAWTRLERLKEQLATEKLYLEDELRAEKNFDEVIGQSPALRRTLAQVETVAATGSTVLILGETGTGKELVARAIHRLSGRGDRTFVKLNCAAIPTGLLESELFGHEKGAFTGAVAAKAGRFELAHKGTLFLDEVGEISPELQPKLLRVLQDQQFERLGGTTTLEVDVRVVAATNRDLAGMVAARQFRSDLYYRLNVFPVHVPPLRERAGDVPLLVRHFVGRAARRMGKRIDTIPAAALAALERHPWPGNVRELEHLVERAVILSRGGTLEVPLAELAVGPPVAAPMSGPAPPAPAPATNAPAGLTPLEAQEREAIIKALEASGWRVGGERGAAAKLGLNRTTLQSKMLKLGIVRPGS
jgi:formate hydrogenlyase transcriptional activator